jgi:hypothetical protein
MSEMLRNPLGYTYRYVCMLKKVMSPVRGKKRTNMVMTRGCVTDVDLDIICDNEGRKEKRKEV